MIWDYDGTLVETRFADEEAVSRIVAREPTIAAGAEAFRATEGWPILDRLELAWPGRGLEFLPLFNEPHPPRIFRGVGRTVLQLHARGFGLAVVSSRRSANVEWGLGVTGIRHLFSRVIGLDDVHEPKPDPEGLELALGALRVQPSRAVYIGDSELDLEAGHRAGMTAWRATWAGPRIGGNTPLLVRTPHQVLDRLDHTQPARSA